MKICLFKLLDTKQEKKPMPFSFRKYYVHFFNLFPEAISTKESASCSTHEKEFMSNNRKEIWCFISPGHGVLVEGFVWCIVLYGC